MSFSRGVQANRSDRVGAILLLCALFGMAGCAPKIVIPAQTGPTVEMLHEIDLYRAAEPKDRSFEYTKSQDPSLLTLSDVATTAGVQFSGPICRIRLSDVLLTTLKNNRAIRVEDYNRTIAEAGIDAAKGIYDLLLDASANYNASKSQGASREMVIVPGVGVVGGGPMTSRQSQHGESLSLSQLMPSGALVSLFAQRLHNKSYSIATPGVPDFSIDPSDSLIFGASVVQPLLKGYGPDITNAPIRIAYIQDEIARENFRNQVIEQLTAAVSLYWDLVFAINNHEVQRVSLERAQELLRTARIEVEVGQKPPNIVAQAQADVATREASVVDAERQIADSADALKRIMNIKEGSEQWTYNLIPTDRPTFAPMNLNAEAIYQEALAYRPDYRAVEMGYRVAQIQERVAHNNLLPQLNATASYQVTGLESGVDDAMDEAETLDYGGYNVGLTLSHPLQNTAAKAGHRQAVADLGRQQESLSAARDQIRMEVGIAVRAIETTLLLIRSWDASVQAERENLESEQARLGAGRSTFYQLLEFQENLATAEVSYLQAVVNFNKAVVELQRVKASFLQDYRVEFVDKPVAERAAQESAPASPKP